MPLKPSRRIPKAFQRRPSEMSRRVARTFGRRERKHEHFFRFTQALRQWKRMERSLHLWTEQFRVWCIALIGESVAALLILSLFSPLFEVKSIRVRRQDARVDIEEIQKLLTPFFGRHLVFLAPRTIETLIRESYPEIASLQVQKHFPHELQVTLFMDPIDANVLVSSPEETEHTASATGSGALSQYITSRGIFLEYPTPLTEAAETKGRLQLRIVDWAVKPSHRQRLLSEPLLHAMQNAEKILRESFGHTVSSITLYARAQEFHVQTERLTLWFDLASPLVQQIDRYREFLRSLPLDSATEYIDLRLHDRV